MKPTRECTLVDLLDRILNKGVLINADIIISVAGVPLIGVTLRAALASIETMLNYGMMEAWDRNIREYYLRDARVKEAPLGEGERIIIRTFGSYWYSEGIYSAWRPGYIYLTDRRLFLFRKEPGQVLFEVPLDEIEDLALMRGMHMGKEREELRVMLSGGDVVRIHAEDLVGLKDAIEGIAKSPIKAVASV